MGPAVTCGTASGLAARTIGVAAYLIGLGGSAALGGFVLLLGADMLPEPRPLPDPWPWLVNAGWLIVFGVQHSGMARAGFKRRWPICFPSYLERSAYVAASGLIAVGMCLTWQPIGGPAFWRGPAWLSVIPILAGAAVGLVCLRFDHAEFFGLRQAWSQVRVVQPETLLVVGPYRYVRHPLMAGLLVMLWVQPVMVPTLAVFSGGLSVYIGVGLLFEERDLLQHFGAAYAAYRRRVPALIPWRWPAPRATYPVTEQKTLERRARQ
jgi:protein-S-isoprenylcysteine O-methyltransferase Ste14